MRVHSVAALLAILLAAACSRQDDGNRNVEATWGLDVIGAAAADSQNVVLPILKCKFDGFVEEVSEYRAWAAKRKDDTARITATVPSAGVYYPAFIFYDSAGDERIAISINGKEVGAAVANLDDNRQRLFYLSQPQTFQGGETIELKALTNTGQYKTEDLLLLKTKPQPKQPEYVITSIEARPTEDSASITFLTSWPTQATVETGDASIKATDPIELNNHRLRLDNLTSGKTYRYRVVAKSRTGQTIASDWQTLRAAPLPAVSGAARKESIPLKLEPGNLPVTTGVPFPKGALGSGDHVRLLAANAEVPLQTRVLQRWPDGSVKWLLLDFSSTTPFAALEYGADVTRAAHPSPLTVTSDAGTVTVDTGPLKFTVSKRRFSLFDGVWRNGQPIVDKPSEFTLTTPDGTAYSSLAPPDEVVVEDNGPVRARIRVAGHHQTAGGKKLFRYVLRIHAWAGQPYVRIQHTFENDNTAADFTEVAGLSLRLPLAGTAKQWALSGAYGYFPAGAAPVTLQQHTDDRYTILPSGTYGRRAAGIAIWNDGARAVTLAVRDFWQNYPKDMTVTPQGLELALMPRLKPNEYDSANNTIDEHRIYYYLKNGRYKLRQGVTKTHDLWLEFGGPQPAAIRNGQQVRMAAATPDWYQQTRVFGEISVPRPSRVLQTYDNAFNQTFDGYVRGRDVNREYGMLNFGDWWGERLINWGNSEYDTQHAFILQFARTAGWRYFRAAEEMEWHNRDIDAIHHHADPIMVGAVYGHAIGHTGSYYADRPTGGAPKGGFRAGSPRSHFAVDHTFIEGHLNYYFLTGDRRSYETALKTADRYNSYFTRNYDFNNCRQPGWHLILTMASYNATNDPYYLNAAKMIVERTLERQTSNGGWKRQMVPGHCHCTPRHEGNAGFMVGVLLTGLRHYYDATNDPRVAEAIVKGARFLVDDMWVPEVKGFRYTSCPKSSSGAWSNFLLFDGIVFAHKRTNDPRLLEVLVRGTEGALQTMTEAGKRDGAAWGKGFTQYSRVVPHFIEHLAALKAN